MKILEVHSERSGCLRNSLHMRVFSSLRVYLLSGKQKTLLRGLGFGVWGFEHYHNTSDHKPYKFIQGHRETSRAEFDISIS